MACMLFLLYPQKLNQRLFTSTYRRYSVLLNANRREKKSRSEKKVWTKQLIEESGSNDEVISNVRGNNSTGDWSELDDEMETGSINDNFRNAFYFVARINLPYFSIGTSCFWFINELATFRSLLEFRILSIHKKSKLQTTNYYCQKLPFRCFWVLSSLQWIYFSFINITFCLIQ